MKAVKFLSLAIVFCMIFSITTAIAAPMVVYDTEKHTYQNLVEKFKDCLPTAWYIPAIEYALENDIMEGVGGNRMEPDRPITRAEFVTVVCRLFAAYNGADIEHYEDVPQDVWYTKYVAMGEQMGIIEGFSYAEFAPEAHITREQAWTILARIMSLPLGEESALDIFYDKEEISEWANGYGAAMVIQGRLRGYLDGYVRPDQNITRAETAQLLMMCFPYLIHGNAANTVYGDNAMLFPNNGSLTTDFKGMEIKGTLILATGLADGIVNMRDSNIGRLVCWGAHDVYVYEGCHFDEITISRTDGPCIIHWPGTADTLPPIYFGLDADPGCKVVGPDGSTLYERPAEEILDPDTPLSDIPSLRRPVYVYKERVYFYPRHNGSKTPLTQYIRENNTVTPVDVPEWEGHVFGGWYYDEACTIRFSFTQTVEDGLKLYGRWYSDAEWTVVDQMNKTVDTSTIRVACETDILATIGKQTIPCYIRNEVETPMPLTFRLVDIQTGALVAKIDRLEPGETAEHMTVISMPEYGNHPVKIICETVDGTGQVEINATLYVAYLWYRGE